MNEICPGDDRGFLDKLGLNFDSAGDAPRQHRSSSKRRKAPARTETSHRNDVVAALNQIGYAIPKHQTMFGIAGTPDVLGCVRGRMVVIEAKREGERPTAAQLGQLRRWQDAGALAGWTTRASDLHELLGHIDDPMWRNDFAVPGDGRRNGQPW